MSGMIGSQSNERAAMPHYTCVTCKSRVRAAQMPAEPVPEPCPRCGRLLEPVVDLADLVGSQLINRRDQPARSPSHGAIAAHLDEFIARRAERLERRRAVLAAACGLGSDDPPANAVAVALPPPRAER